ncbi:type II secretion system F family protein [Methylobacillus glycogenes]|uniref:type II secretion system F family protein n=1 Tax=Methylobacillus glycogenes TaxID=406 RepID=UPI0004703D31|nr:type II secretion system F family protein [Methylobacillus glycogenes]
MSLLTSFQLWQAKRALLARRADFYYDLASALEDKVPLFTTLRNYEMRARKRDPSAAKLYQQMLRESMNGSLSQALRGIMPPSELIMIDAIQTAGDAALSRGLYFMSETVEKIDKMMLTMRKAVIYPIMLFVIFAALLTGFSFFAVPVLEELMAPEKWPLLGRILYVISSTVRHDGLIILICLIVAIVAFVRSLPNWHGPWRRKVDNWMPYSLYRDFSGAMLIVSLSSLMRTGVSLRSSLERAIRFSTPWMRWHLQQILRGLASEHAAQFGHAFRTGVLSMAMEDRVQDAAERRDPVAAFVKIGVGSIDRIERSMVESAGKLNGIMMAVAGVVLGIMMMGFFSTAFEMQSAIQQSATGMR